MTAPLPTVKNPVFNAADPHAVVVGDTVWIYPTFSIGREQAFFAFSSTNLTGWQRTTRPILRFRDVKWIDEPNRKVHFAWAPCMIEKDGQFYFYYSVGDQNVTPSRIGVGVGKSPAGPFVDSGKPLVNDGAKDVFEAIDPMVFTDKDNKSYLYAGGSNGSKLRIWELGGDMVSLAREIDVTTPPQFTEGAFMHERDGKFYLTYSHGGWRDASYSVHYAIGASPTGPFEYQGAILTSDDKHKGPGHHSIITSATGNWYIVYHRWNDREGNGPYSGGRSVAIDKLEYNDDGTIKPVVMTDAGLPVDRFGTANVK